MSQQLSLDISDTSERDASIELVGNAADARFLIEAQAAVKATAEQMEHLTTDDVRPNCKLTPSEPRAWGWIMVKAAESGIIQ
jgi:hypothetical protein